MRQLSDIGLVLLLGAALILSTGACGGSGTAATTTTPSLNALLGTYCFTSWRGDGGGPLAAALWGTVDADGISVLTPVGLYENQAGTVTGPHTPDAAVYVLGDDNALSVLTSGNAYVGGLASDASVAALAETKDGAQPGVLILGRTGLGFDLSSLSGVYHVCAFYLVNSATKAAMFGGEATFDGAGNCTGFFASFNADGQIGADAYPQFGTYDVAADGTMTWEDPLDLGPWTGGLYAGGEVAVLSGGAKNGNDAQTLMVLIKKSAGLTDATLSGTYTTVALIGSGGGFGSYTGQTTADGMGTWDLTAGTLNANGVLQPLGPAPGQAYEVSDDGRLEMNGGTHRGAVSSTGRFAVYAGGTANNSERALWFLVR